MGSNTSESIRNRKEKTKNDVSKLKHHGQSTPSGSDVKDSLCWRCLNVMKYMLLFIIIPPFVNFAALNIENQQLIPDGALYDIGKEQKLFFSCLGSGKPTVLLDAPTGMSSDVWSLVSSKLSKVTKVCIYDRAGLGFSDRPKQNSSISEEDQLKDLHRWHEYTVERMADDLHRLIAYSTHQVEKPFVFVGSELGSLVARFYSQMYENDVSDLVLIDPIVEGIFELDEKVWQKFWYGQLLPSAQSMQMAAAVGLTRFALMFGLLETPIQASGLDVNVTNRQKYLMCNPRHLSSVVDEHHFMTESLSQIQTLFRLKPFPSNVSITVITGNYYDEQLPSQLNKAWAKSTQHLISKLHPSSNHIVVNGADHKMLYRQPDAIVDPIKRIVKQWKMKARD